MESKIKQRCIIEEKRIRRKFLKQIFVGVLKRAQRPLPVRAIFERCRNYIFDIKLSEVQDLADKYACVISRQGPMGIKLYLLDENKILLEETREKTKNIQKKRNQKPKANEYYV